MQTHTFNNYTSQQVAMAFMNRVLGEGYKAAIVPLEGVKLWTHRVYFWRGGGVPPWSTE